MLLACESGERTDRTGNRGAHLSAADPAPGIATAPKSAPLRLALITDLGGVLEPCGCTASTAGGIDRLAAAVGALRASPGPLLVAGSGDFLFAPEPAPGFGGARRDALDVQAALKADALASFLRQLGLDVLGPGPSDLMRAGSRLRDIVRGKRPLLVGGGAAPEGVELEWVQLLRAGQYQVAFQSDPLRKVAADVSPLSAADLRVSFEHGPDSATAPSKVLERADIVVRSGLPHSAGFARQLHSQIEVYAGHHAQELWVLDVWPGENRDAPWELTSEAPARPGLRNLVRARSLRLNAGAPADPGVRRFMDQVFARLDRGQRELAHAEPAPAPPAARQPRYVGSRTCAACHTAAYFWWQQTPHARAYQTLLQRQRGLDLDCIGCHVTGFEQPGGARLGQLEELTAVGCESCHGPGSAHADNPGVRSPALHKQLSAATCAACHDVEHSDAFDYALKRALLLQPGHGR